MESSITQLGKTLNSPEFVRGLLHVNLPLINLSRVLYGLDTFDTVDEYLEYKATQGASIQEDDADDADVMAEYVKYLRCEGV